jgi:hypothetical protein
VDFSFKIALFFCHSAAHPIPLQPLMMPIGKKSTLCNKVTLKNRNSMLQMMIEPGKKINSIFYGRN